MRKPRGPVKDLTGDVAVECREAIRSIVEIARIRMFQAHFDDALSLLGSAAALPIYGLADAREHARLFLLKAEALMFRARFAGSGHDAVLGPLEKAAALAEELNDKRLVADVAVLRGWALAYRHIGAAPPEVHAHAQRSLDRREEIDDQVGIAEALFLIGLVHEQKKDRTEEDVAKAEASYREVLAVTERIGEKRWRSYATRHLGWISLHREDLDEALPFFEESLRLRREIGLRILVAQAYYALGATHLERGELDEAVSHCQRAYNLATELGNPSTRFWALLAIGEVHERRGEREQAMDCYRQVLEAAPAIGEALVDAAKDAIERLEETS
ncbi:MAG: tetratricopeptide repeat protein [Candidatus Bipolaricaulota bacterium]|nr:MAG: tetratricopeptide repeat protein [Candidatus Bipolaricaulota bacterium]